MEYPQVYFEKWRVSRKPHKCCDCKGTIFYKERYLYCSGVWDSRGDSYKTCSDCAELRNEINKNTYYDDGVALGELREYIFEKQYIPDISKFVEICDKRGVMVRPETRQLVRKGKY